MIKNKNVLIIAPHQDDEVIGCGGTIALLAEKGYVVFVVHIFKGSSGVTNKTAIQTGIIRQREALKASKVLKFKLLENLLFEDRKEIDITKIQRSLISVVREIKPSVVIAPHTNDQDFEHQMVSKATWEACWLAATDNFKELGKKISKISVILGYEVWTPIQRPDFYLDVTRYIKQKEKALKEFPSQIKGTSWLIGSVGLNAYRGTTLLGNGYAEAFEVRTSDLSVFVEILSDLSKGKAI